MQEYIQELQEKAGLTKEQATKAMTVLVDKIKSKVPDAFHGIINNLFSDKEENASDSFQKKYETFTEQTEEKLKKFSGKAEEEFKDFANKAEDMAEDTQKKSEEMIKDIKSKLSDMFGKQKPPSE